MSKSVKTIVTHAGSKPQEYHGALNVPPHRMSTVVFRTLEEFENQAKAPYVYGRNGTPSSVAFEEAIAAIEGAYKSVSTCSGLSAIVSAVISVTERGDHILVTDNCYGPGRRSFNHLLTKYGVEVEYFPPMIGADIQKLFRPNTKLVFLEAPGSLTYEVQDIGTLIQVAKQHGIRTAIDNSWATPLFLRPLDLGVDMSVMSATKYISGHSDVMLGVVSSTEECYPSVRRAAQALGLCAGSEELYLGLRGFRTLATRMEQHQKNGLEIAQWLATHPAVKRVLHPALPSCTGHENWKKYFTGSSGTFSVILHETRREKIAAMVDGMEIFSMGFSWGGFESLLFPEQPQPIRTAVPWNEDGFSLRLHIGLEDVQDLKTDIEHGLMRLSGT